MGKNIIIFGGGYAGIQAAKKLLKTSHGDNTTITIIDRNPYHTLLTELHEAAAGRVPPQAVRIPYNEIFRKGKVNVIDDIVSHIDFSAKTIKGISKTYGFDYLVIATGSRPAFFNIPGAERFGFKLWSYKESLLLREHIADCFIRASECDSMNKRKELLSFVIAGGGFTGVEMAGELAEWRDYLCRHYSINRAEVSITLVEAMPDILGVFKQSLVKKVKKRLEKMDVKILTDAGITSVEHNKTMIGEKTLGGTLIWTAGIQGASFLKSSDLKMDNKFRVDTNEYLQSNQYDFVFCAGDIICAGNSYPQVVETAVQSGKTAALNVRKHFKGHSMKKFKPKYHGTVVSIGFWYAGANVMGMSFTGIFGTAIKQLINLRYMWKLGKVRLVVKYLLNHFIYKYLFKGLKINSIENTKKNITQDLSVLD